MSPAARAPSLACWRCGNPLAPEGYLMLTVEAGAGPRKRADEAPFFATRRTVTANVPVCVYCLESPAGELIAALVSDRAAKPVGVYPDQCVVVCARRRPRLRKRLGLGSVVVWPDSGKYRCPVCGLPARGWGVNAPRSELERVASFVRRRFAVPPREAAPPSRREAAR